jgi:hypothetical protein
MAFILLVQYHEKEGRLQCCIFLIIFNNEGQKMYKNWITQPRYFCKYENVYIASDLLKYIKKTIKIYGKNDSIPFIIN